MNGIFLASIECVEPRQIMEQKAFTLAILTVLSLSGPASAQAGDNVFREFGRDMKSAGKQAGKTGKQVGKSIGRTGKKVGKSVGKAAKDVFTD